MNFQLVAGLQNRDVSAALWISFSSVKTLLIPREPIRAPLGVNVPGSSLAGFQVTLVGRFWPTPEASMNSPSTIENRKTHLWLARPCPVPRLREHRGGCDAHVHGDSWLRPQQVQAGRDRGDFAARPEGLRLNGVCRLINSDRRLSKRRLDGDQASKPVECTTCDTH